MTTENGIVLDWNDEKGFGFIAPKSGGRKLFFHINNYSQRHKRPLKNLKVQYVLSTDRKGKPCAVDVAPIRGHKNNGYELRQKVASTLVFCLFTTTLYILYAFQKIPLEIVCIYGVTSILAFIMYAKDKNAAEWGKWRTPESTLHLLAIVGGWPGAKIAQSFLRHKSKKMSFRITYWVTVCINCGALYWLTTPEGSMWLKTILKNVKIG